MPVTNLLYPNMMLGINTGGFGKSERQTSHFGALNTYVNSTTTLFDSDTLEKIRKTPFTRTITIPILNSYDHTIITIRTCDITTTDINATLKQITRFHIAVDVDIIPARYQDNYLDYQRAFQHKVQSALFAIYLYLDRMCAAHLDANKDVTQLVGAQGLYVGTAGAFQLPKTLDFYNNLLAIMESLEVHGPFFDVANTAALADQNWLRNPGGGAAFDTKSIMDAAQISSFEYSNRIAPGNGTRGVHYIAPQGSVGIVNFIDYDYQVAPDLNTIDPTDEKDISDVRYWGKINDKLFPQWQWGVMQLLDCSQEQKTYKAKQSADFALVSDFMSKVGASPIKRFDIMGA